MEEIKGKVVPFSEIPKDVLEGHLLNEYMTFRHTFAQFHIDETEDDDKVSEWLLSKYPELKDEEYFFIKF